MNNMFEDDSDYLEHHGVLGMKWGVRKERPSSNGGASSSREAKKASIKSKIAKRMSDRRGGLSARDYIQRRSMDKRIIKEQRKGRVIRNGARHRVGTEVAQAISSDKKYTDLWKKAVKANQNNDTISYIKHTDAMKKRMKEVAEEQNYDRRMVNAFIRDNGYPKVSSVNRQYLLEVQQGKRPLDTDIRASRKRDNRAAKYINRLSSKQLKKSEKAATSANKWRSLAEKQKNPSDKKLYREFAKADERTSQRYKDLSKKLSSSKVSKSNSKKQIRQNVKAQGRDIEKLRDDEYMRRINKNQKR